MDFTQIKYYIYAVEEGNLSQAADKLFITQSALSKSISRLEDSLGYQLFERDGHKMEPTPEGRMFYNWGIETIKSYENILTDMDEYRRINSRTLSIAVSGTRFSAPMIYGFMQLHKDIHIDESFFKRSEFPSILYNNQIDCILSSRTYQAENINSLLIYTEPLYLVVPSSHRFASKKSIKLRELEGEQLLFTSKDNLFLDTLQEIYDKARLELILRAGLERDHLWGAVEKGLGIVIAARGAIDNKNKSLRTIELTDNFCKRSVYLIWKERNPFKEPLKDFIDYIEQKKSEFS